MKLQALFLFLISTVLSFGLQVRDGDTTDNARFTGFPSPSAVNPNYAYSNHDFTGVGWFAQDTRRQFALVSPQHFVCATHFRPAATGQVRFLGSDGVVYTYEIANTQIIQNANGQNTDLSIGTLETVVDTSVITPLKYANVSDSAVIGDAIIFGFPALTADTDAIGFVDPGFFAEGNLAASFNNTRYIVFQHIVNASGANDSFLEGGDSGSPVFIINQGSLGLVGTNSLISSATDETTGDITARFAFSAYIPEYISQLDAALSDEGYVMTGINTQNTNLSLAINTSSQLRQGYPGSVDLILSNSPNNDAHNISVTVTNTTSLPTSLSATDYFDGLVTSSSIETHSTTLLSSDSDTIQVSWDTLPSVSSLTFDVTFASDESGIQTQTFTITLDPTGLGDFFIFTDGQIDPSLTGDDDGDSIVNLLEYALAGDLTTSSRTTTSGRSILPEFDSINDTFSFLRRTDASNLGLVYTVQSSTTLDVNDWQTFSLSSASTSSVTESGFELVTVPISDNAPNQIFYRLLVEIID